MNERKGGKIEEGELEVSVCLNVCITIPLYVSPLPFSLHSSFCRCLSFHSTFPISSFSSLPSLLLFFSFSFSLPLLFLFSFSSPSLLPSPLLLFLLPLLLLRLLWRHTDSGCWEDGQRVQGRKWLEGYRGMRTGWREKQVEYKQNNRIDEVAEVDGW